MRRLLSIMLGLLLISSQLLAQNRTVSGKIVDEKGNPIVNASVLVKGTNVGTTTSGNGTFSLALPDKARTLVVSYIGMGDREVNLTSESNYSITLSANARDLDEVVVVGYGTKTVRENVGAVSKVSGAKVAAEPVTSFEQALAGKTAGVQISLGSGILADRTAIRVRGINSISASSQPLIVIDGIPQN